MKLKYTVTSIQRLQQKIYQFSDEQLKIEAEDLINNPITWLQRWFNFNKGQSLILISMSIAEKRMLAVELSFALENRLPIRFWSQRYTCSSLKNLDQKDIDHTNSFASFWKAGQLQICLNQYPKMKLQASQSNYQLTYKKTLSPKIIPVISAISAHFNRLIKYNHGL